MSKKNIAAAVLGVLAILFIARAFLSSPVPPAPPSSSAKTPAGQAEAATTGGSAATAPAAAAAPKSAGAPADKAGPINLDELAKGVLVVDFLYDQTALARNPMNPLVGPQAVFAATASEGTDPKNETELQAKAEMLSQTMAVTGIIWDKRFPVAVINDDVVAPGDELPDGVVVQAIEPDRVVVKVGQTSVPLQLKKTEEQ